MPIFPLGTLAAGIVGGFTGAAAEVSLEPITSQFQDRGKYLILVILVGILAFWYLGIGSKRRR